MSTTVPSLTPVGILVLAIVFGSSDMSAQRDRVPPTAPTNLVVTSTTDHSVSLAWGPSTDNSGRFSYLICCAGPTVTVSQTMTGHTLEGLQSGKTYTFRVYAKDAAGNLSKSSNSVTVTLPGQVAAPTKPVVGLLDVGPTHASVTWSSTDDGSFIWYTIFIDGAPVSYVEFEVSDVYVRRRSRADGLYAAGSRDDLCVHRSGARHRRELVARQRSRLRDNRPR